MAKYDKETKFYWLQLKEDFFEEDSIEWLEEQENGHKYSLFYLKLCLKSLKTNGILIRKVGNMLVPYDNKKLSEMTKTPVDTVIVAMELLKGIGLVQILENGELYITQLENMIGSQSKSALKKQQQRQLKQQLLLEGGQEGDKCPPKIDIEIELEQEIKDKEIKKEKKKIFKKPTIEEVKEYCQQRNNNIDAEYFIDYYETKDWLIGKNKMKDWKACVRTWEKRDFNKQSTKQPVREEIVPEWMHKTGEELKEELTPEKKKEIAELQARLKAKYGKGVNND